VYSRDMNNRIIVIFIVVLGLIGLGSAVLFRAPSGPSEIQEEVFGFDERAYVFEDPGIEGDFIVVPDQVPDPVILVGRVHFTKPGFVAIYTSENSEPAELIGKSNYIEAGKHVQRFVTLNRVPVDGEELIAFVVHDDGSTGFKEHLDERALDANGAFVHAIFKSEQYSPVNVRYLITR
jgi:hypothetical protein